ncbi:MAG: Uncharacterized protein XD80_1754 [Synergistales bacterium 53_16]|jgi:cell division protein FtsL|nr:MAG: Uncharacterized protein XD80_1754 [Synergistales bacterium 53_16]
MIAETLHLPFEEKKQIKGRGSICILLCAGVASLLMGLVALRLYSLDLEYKLADIQRQIVIREEEQARLEKDLAGLLNPTRVYSYARSELGMKASANIGIVKVSPSERPMMAGNGETGAETGRFRRALVWLVDSVTGKASARQ